MSRRRDGLRAIALAALAAATLKPATVGSSPGLGDERGARQGDLGVRRTVVAHDVVDGEPVWADVPFIDDGEPIYVFLEVDNVRPSPVTLAVSVVGRQATLGPMTATVPARSTGWRTWVTLPNGVPSGHFTATVRTSDGRVLDRVTFEVEG